tara:strand:+ start:3128 stop:3832 length:705 start_codon:yes stop_codon:yes gene_type:complete
MGSLTGSGWTNEDAKNEINQIVETIGELGYNNRASSETLEHAQSTLNFIYLDSNFSSEVRGKAFKALERVEFSRIDPYRFLISDLREALDEQVADDSVPEHEKQAASDIVTYLLSKLNEYALTNIRPDKMTYNTIDGNYIVVSFEDRSYITPLAVVNSPEAFGILSLTKEVIKFPYDYIECVELAKDQGYETVEDYFTYLIDIKKEEWLKKAILKHKILHPNLRKLFRSLEGEL